MSGEKNRNVGIHYVFGLSLGIGGKPTALAVLEQVTGVKVSEEGGGRKAELREARLGHLERRAVGESYPDIANWVFELLDELKPKEEDGESSLVVDITGCGRSGAGLLKSRTGLYPIFVTIKLGAEEQWDKEADFWRIGKAELVSNMHLLMQTGRLKFAEELPLWSKFRSELENFQIRPPSIKPNDVDAWRDTEHDDLVLAVGIAAWQVSRHTPLPPSMKQRRRWEPRPESGWMGA